MHGVCNAMSNGMERDWELCSFGVHAEFSLFPYRFRDIISFRSFVNSFFLVIMFREILTKYSNLINGN